jgi:hypothetical protein
MRGRVRDNRPGTPCRTIPAQNAATAIERQPEIIARSVEKSARVRLPPATTRAANVPAVLTGHGHAGAWPPCADAYFGGPSGTIACS